ncbi:WD40 repeat protein [Terracoccus luteus]|uniref:WD40 repeat protein n=2 Tax=Terracoccus luteus TaxID=53356 RepID=A0A495Y145_9MICO|nr:WD40 repeat protein [Terracoccus luteus]
MHERASTLNNGALLISAEDGVYTIYPDGSRKTLVSTWLRGGQFSPDGKLIAWSGTVDGNTDVYITDDRGGSLRRVTKAATYEATPTWSPDGKKLAFESCRPPGTCDVYTLNSTVPYGKAKRITDSRVIPNGCDSFRYHNPKWSPRGNEIVVGGYCGIDNWYGDFIAIGITPQGVPTREYGLAYSWDWNGNGTALATDNASDNDQSGFSNIRWCLTSQTRCTEVTPDQTDDTELSAEGPVVSPTTNLIAYRKGFDSNIWFNKPDGTRARLFMNSAVALDWRRW